MIPALPPLGSALLPFDSPYDVMLLVAAAVFGTMFGSFTNVLISRIPAGEQWASGPSHCPSCLTDIKWYDNVPLIGWLNLRGKCRACGWRIPAVYPVVEATVGVLWVLSAIAYGYSVLTLVMWFAAIPTATVAVMALRDQSASPRFYAGAIATVGAGVVIHAVTVGDPGAALGAVVGAVVMACAVGSAGALRGVSDSSLALAAVMMGLLLGAASMWAVLLAVVTSAVAVFSWKGALHGMSETAPRPGLDVLPVVLALAWFVLLIDPLHVG